MTNKTIKFIATAILISMSFLAANAQEQTIADTTEGSAAKVEKKETVKKQTSTNDSWTGFYVGGFGGYTNGRANAKTSTTYVSPGGYFTDTAVPAINSAGNRNLNSNGFNGGATAGYNYQKDKFFIGAEVDFGSQRLSKNATSTVAYPCCAPGGSFTVSQTVKSDWMMTVRPRTGVALNKALVYATGGLAMANIKYDGRFTDTFGPALETGSIKKMKIGWTAGAGMEFKVSNNWSVKGEYLYSQFGSTSITVSGFQTSPTGSRGVNTFTHSTDLKSHSLRFGVNYRF